MRFENILIGDEGLDKQLDKMFEFRKYMTYRRLSTETVANAWIDSVEDVKTQVRRKGADMIHLNMARFGGIDQTIEALLVCKNQSFPVMLGGSPFETVRSAQIACHIAIATQPDLLVAKHSSGDDGGIVLMQNEMARIQTELKYNHKE
jgi:methylaspartate ammonia-lyase